MTDKITRFRMLHGIVKGAIRNIIDLAHSRIPKEDLVTDGKNKPGMPELGNIHTAFERAIDKFDACHHQGFRGVPSYKVLKKGKEVGLSALSSDSAYYVMTEYMLKEYVHLKMDAAFGYENVEKAFVEQWWVKHEELKAK